MRRRIRIDLQKERLRDGKIKNMVQQHRQIDKTVEDRKIYKLLQLT